MQKNEWMNELNVIRYKTEKINNGDTMGKMGIYETWDSIQAPLSTTEAVIGQTEEASKTLRLITTHRLVKEK